MTEIKCNFSKETLVYESLEIFESLDKKGYNLAEIYSILKSAVNVMEHAIKSNEGEITQL